MQSEKNQRNAQSIRPVLRGMGSLLRCATLASTLVAAAGSVAHAEIKVCNFYSSRIEFHMVFQNANCSGNAWSQITNYPIAAHSCDVIRPADFSGQTIFYAATLPNGNLVSPAVGTNFWNEFRNEEDKEDAACFDEVQAGCAEKPCMNLPHAQADILSADFFINIGA